MKIEGSASASASGSISQRDGSADTHPDPEPHQIVMDPQHWFKQNRIEYSKNGKKLSTIL